MKLNIELVRSLDFLHRNIKYLDCSYIYFMQQPEYYMIVYCSVHFITNWIFECEIKKLLHVHNSFRMYDLVVR